MDFNRVWHEPPGFSRGRNNGRLTGKLMTAMMGTKARIFTPVAVVSLEDLVPATHFYRHLDRVLNVAFVRDLVKETYAERGRPSIDPVVFFKLQLVMFFEDIVRCANRLS
jgi:hypothetical protein